MTEETQWIDNLAAGGMPYLWLHPDGRAPAGAPGPS